MIDPWPWAECYHPKCKRRLRPGVVAGHDEQRLYCAKHSGMGYPAGKYQKERSEGKRRKPREFEPGADLEFNSS